MPDLIYLIFLDDLNYCFIEINGQATKGSRWIPWHTEAMKDVVTCDKSRGAGSTL